MQSRPTEPIAQTDVRSTDRMSFEEFVRATSPLLVPALPLYGSAFTLLVVGAHWVVPGRFGAVATIVSSFVLLAAPASAVTAAVATGVWPGDALADDLVGAPRLSVSLRRLAPFALAWMGVVLLASLGVARLADVSLALSTLLWLAVALSLLASVPLGYVYAAAGPRTVGWVALATGIARPAIGTALFAVGLEPFTAVLVALATAELLAVVLGVWRSRARSPGDRASAFARFSLGGSFQGIVVATLGLALLSTVDVFLAQEHLAGPAAGRYVGAAVVARTLLFVPAVAALFLMPRLRALRVIDPFRWLRRSLAVSGAALLAAWVGMTAFRTQLASALLGGAFRGSADVLPWLAGFAGLLAIVWQLSLFHKTVRSRSHASNHVLAGVSVVLAAVVPPTPEVLAWLMVGVATIAFLFQYQGARAICRWSPPLSLLHPHEEVATPLSHQTTDVELSVILPCRNAAPAVRGFLRELIERLELEPVASFEVIVVSDGSTDDTVRIAREFTSPSVRVFHYPKGWGKGHALRVGLSEARGLYVGFIDSDGDIDPEAIGPFLSLMKLYDLDIVLGSKRHPMSEVNYPIVRRVMSWVYHKVARALFLIDVRDTQTGFKVIRREVLTAVLPRMLEKRYAFDLELLVIARLLGYRKVFEAPVRINYRFSSQVVPTTALRILLDTAAIFYRRYILNTYAYAGDRLAVVAQEPDVPAHPVREL
jgi:Glycosyl transferase family 2